MHKDIGNKIYLIIICILLFSIVYQTGYLIVNAKNNNYILADNTSAENSEVTEKTDETEETEETEEVETNDGISLYLYLLKQVIPYNRQNTDYTDGLKEVIEYFTKVDFSDPKTLISSQIPIIESYEEDDVNISSEEEKEIYNITTSKPLNNDQVEVSNLNSEPLVLIYHTHTTESYTSSSKTQIDYCSYCRSLKEEYNMVAVGSEIAKAIEEGYRINVIHDTTVHDYPSYEKSYSNSLKTIQSNLEKYPSIKYVFDIHRDGLSDNTKNQKRYQAVINDIDYAKIMIVIGMNHENSSKNSAFADVVYNKINSAYPELTISTLKRSTAKYNQFVRDNALLFEVGSNLSTLEEAKASGECLGDILGQIIIEKETN